ncbi:hypothetical protein LTR50_005088 [Elasticomyces elasticus]|nr:hypothetical protein LTR50_005088 [Elasticomyces elasticus]
MAPILIRDTAEPAGGPTATILIGVGVGVGGILLLAIITLLLRIRAKRKEHVRLMRAMEQAEMTLNASEIDIAAVPRPVSILRRSIHLPYNIAAGWGALPSNETVHEEALINRAGKRLSSAFVIGHPDRRSIAMPNRIRKSRPIPTKPVKTKHLSAIIESPKSQAKIAPQSLNIMDCSHNASHADQQNEARTPAGEDPIPPHNHEVPTTLANETLEASPSPTLRPKPLFSSTNPGRDTTYDVETAKACHSKSVGNFLETSSENAGLPYSTRNNRPSMHLRSISLGSQKAGLAPKGPVPPLPGSTTTFHINNRPNSIGRRSPSRNSVSSVESAGSSILAHSPALQLPSHAGNGTFRVRDIPESDAEAQVKSGAHGQDQLVGPRRPDSFRSDQPGIELQPQQPTRRNAARYSVDSVASERLSCASIVSTDSGNNRLSVGQIKVADRVSISRVSSCGSLQGTNNVQIVKSPARRFSRSQVSIYGSPAERRKASILRDVSGNSVTPSRRASYATQCSSDRSSNGNPFQWDGPMLPGKPSALKGSPSARKGHKRQNCVRISVLAPTILGPHSRCASPVPMRGIQEESPEPNLDEENTPPFRLRATPTPGSAFPSSPTLPLKSKSRSQQEYDPAWPTLSIPVQDGSQEYDPASPVLEYPTPDSSSPTFPFAIDPPSSAQSQLKQLRRASTTQRPISPPCSPKTKPSDVPSSPASVITFSGPTNASSLPRLLARTPKPVNDLFATAPSLPPPTTVLPALRPRTNSNVTSSQIPRGPPPPQISTTPTPPRSTTSPPPPLIPPRSSARLHAPPNAQSPIGPRSEPPRDLRKSVMALRRMNSEMQVEREQSREDRRYLRMGREASPLLPFSEFDAGDGAEAASSCFDFGFGGRGDGEGGEGDGGVDALQHVGCGGMDLVRRTSALSTVSVASRASSVWEDGERFWGDESTAVPSGTDHAAKPCRRPSVERVRDSSAECGQLSTPALEHKMQDPRRSLLGKAVTGGIIGTPRSLYGPDGFLIEGR